MLNFITNPVQKAQVAAMTYYDRTGQFPNATTAPGPLAQMYQAGIDGVLDLKNPFITGSDTFGIALGYISVTDTSGNTANYPVILIQPVTVTNGVPNGNTSWTASEVGYANYLKSKIDGNTSSWTTGSVRMLNTPITVTYNSLSSEITTNTPTTSTYDGYFTPPGPYSTSAFVTPTVGQAYTLVYFYNQQPH
jgi:hypothetical protein